MLPKQEILIALKDCVSNLLKVAEEIDTINIASSSSDDDVQIDISELKKMAEGK